MNNEEHIIENKENYCNSKEALKMSLNIRELDFLLSKLEECATLYLVIKSNDSNSNMNFSLVSKLVRNLKFNKLNSFSYFLDNSESEFIISFTSTEKIEILIETKDAFCNFTINDNIIFTTNMQKEYFLFIINHIHLLGELEKVTDIILKA